MKTINIIALALLVISSTTVIAQQKKAVSKAQVKTNNTQLPANSANYWVQFGNNENSTFKIKNSAGKFITNKAKPGGVRYFQEGMAAVAIYGNEDEESQSKFGFVDQKFKIIVAPKYKAVGDFTEGFAWAEDFNGKIGFIDKTGKTVIKFKYDDARNFHEGYCPVNIGSVTETGYLFDDDDEKFVSKRGGKWGFVNKSGKEICPIKYSLVKDFAEGMANVTIEGEHYTLYSGYINQNGEEQIPLIYDQTESFNEGLAAVQLNKKCGYIDKTGKVIIAMNFDGAESFIDGFAIVNKGGKTEYSTTANGGKFTFINRTGKLISDFKFDGIYNFESGLAKVRSGKMYSDSARYGFVNTAGKEILPMIYNYIETLSRGYYQLTLENKNGIIDSLGIIVLPVEYDDIEHRDYPIEIKNTFQAVYQIEINHKYGYINNKGQIVVPVIYDKLGYFEEEKLTYCKKIDGKYGYIDKMGKEVLPSIYDEAENFYDGSAEVTLNGKKIIINSKGVNQNQNQNQK